MFLILVKYHVIELPMPTTTIVLKKFECLCVSKFMGNYDYYTVIIHNSMITIRPTTHHLNYDMIIWEP